MISRSQNGFHEPYTSLWCLLSSTTSTSECNIPLNQYISTLIYTNRRNAAWQDKIELSQIITGIYQRFDVILHWSTSVGTVHWTGIHQLLFYLFCSDKCWQISFPVADMEANKSLLSSIPKEKGCFFLSHIDEEICICFSTSITQKPELEPYPFLSLLNSVLSNKYKHVPSACEQSFLYIDHAALV